MTPPVNTLARDLVILAGIATGVHHSRIYSTSRVRRLVRIRWVIMHTLRVRHAWSFQEIADEFGCDHSNVIHGVNRATALLGKDHWFTALSRSLTA